MRDSWGCLLEMEQVFDLLALENECRAPIGYEALDPASDGDLHRSISRKL